MKNTAPYYFNPALQSVHLVLTPQTIRSYIKQGRFRGQRIGRPILLIDKYLKEFLKPSTV